MANIKDELKTFKKKFNKSFFDYLDKRLNKTSDFEFRQYLFAQNKYFKKGGKRLRPFLTAIFYQGFSGRKSNKTYK